MDQHWQTYRNLCSDLFMNTIYVLVVHKARLGLNSYDDLETEKGRMQGLHLCKNLYHISLHFFPLKNKKGVRTSRGCQHKPC